MTMKVQTRPIRFADIFCGIGGFHIAASQAAEQRGLSVECVFASDIDSAAQRAYEANFKLSPFGDITKISSADIPDHDLLFGGFPCQAFSICGDQRGFEDTRGTLFFELARILEAKKPRAFVFENVKQLASHDNGKTLHVILGVLKDLGYFTNWKVLNALDYGVPQKRERILIVGFREPLDFAWPKPIPHTTSLEEILEDDNCVEEFYWATQKIRQARAEKVANKSIPEGRTVWHENKGGNIGVHKFSCAMRAGASHNYLLVDGKRRMTEREMLRLQGFPDSFRIVCSYGETRRQAGNSVAVPCIQAVIGNVIDALERHRIDDTGRYSPFNFVTQQSFAFEHRVEYVEVHS